MRVSAVLLALLNVCFFPAIWGNRTLLLSAQDTPSVLSTAAWGTQNEGKLTFSKTLDPGAPAWQEEPQFDLDRKVYTREHSVPLWNPYQGYGTPLAANMQSQTFSPLTLPLFVALTPRTYSLFLLARLFIAGLSMFAFLRFFVSFPAALCGAIATTLGGYYIVFLNMSQLSVEIWLPAALWAGEYLLRRPSFRGFLQLAAVIWLVMVGGMPESAALLLLFAYLYVAFRLLTDLEIRPAWRLNLLLFGSAGIAGLLLSAFLLFPFLEFVRNSFNGHEKQHIGLITGLAHDPLSASIFTYLFPLLFGPPITDVFPGIFTGLRNYFGIIPLVLMLLAAGRMFMWEEKNRMLNLLTLFFSATVVLVLMKRYGFGPINIFGRLPVLDLILFPKYDELLLTVSVAVVCSLAVEYILLGEVKTGAFEKAFLLTFLLVPIALFKSKASLVRALTYSHVGSRFAVAAIGIPAALLFMAVLLTMHYSTRTAGDRMKRLALGFIGLVTIELSCNFIIPLYLFFGGLPYASRNPFSGAPFVSFLKGKTTQAERVFGRDLMLHPDWASAFELCDIRNLDALYYRKYFPFLQAFLGKPAGTLGIELGDRFRGEGEYKFDTAAERRLLQLSSVKYIVSARSFDSSDEFVTELLNQNAGKIEPGKEAFVRRVNLIVNGLGRTGLQEHPPYSRLPYQISVPKGDHEELSFSYTIDPAVWNGPGDGVNFKLEVQNAKGEVKPLFSSYIDPKHDPNERRWNEAKVDLTPYQGQTVKLLLSTDPGPKGDSAADWADWAGFEFPKDTTSTADRPFKPIYAKEAQIFEFDNVLPRAALYFRADLQNSEGAALKRLTDPSFDVFSAAVLDSSILTPDQAQAVARLNDGPGASPVKPATIRRYESHDVEISSEADRSSLLVLNDSDFPGWYADVDGKPAAIISANYMFRGVLLTPGKHRIRFNYNPASFRIGATLSGLTLLMLIAAYPVVRRRENRTRTPGKTHVPSAEVPAT